MQPLLVKIRPVFVVALFSLLPQDLAHRMRWGHVCSILFLCVVED